MNIDGIKIKLEQEINENNKKIEELELKNKILKANLIESNAFLSMVIGIIPMLLELLTFPFWNKLFPVGIHFPLIMGTSFLIGAGTTIFIRAKQQIKKLLGKFSKAKKQQEIQEEIIKCNIEKAKILNKNKFLKSACETLNFKDEYDVIKSRLLCLGYKIEEIQPQQDMEQINQNVEKIKKLTVDYQHQISKITEDYELALQNTTNNMILPPLVFGGLGLAMSIIGTFFLLPYNPSTITPIIESMCPGIITFALGMGYSIKRSSDIKKANKKVSDELGSTVLDGDDNKIYEEQIRLEKLLNAIIQRAAETKVQWELENATLENLQKESQSFEERSSYSEEEIRDYMRVSDFLQEPDDTAVTFGEKGSTRNRIRK